MKTYRFKNRKELEEEFGKLWRKQIPYGWPEKMDYLLGSGVDEFAYEEICKNEFVTRKTHVFAPGGFAHNPKDFTIHKSMLTCDEEKGAPQGPHERQMENVYKLVTHQDLAIEQLNQKIDQLQAQVDEITVYVPSAEEAINAEQKLLDKTKDDAAKEEGYKDWNDMTKCLFDHSYGHPGMYTLDDIVNKAMKDFNRLLTLYLRIKNLEL